MLIKKKEVRLSVEEKIWILNHRKENPLISQNKIAYDFSAKLKKNMRHQSPSKERSTFSLFEKQKILQQLQKLRSYCTTYICIRLNHDEMVTLEFIPEIGEQKLPEKPQIQSCITQFFKNNK